MAERTEKNRLKRSIIRYYEKKQKDSVKVGLLSRKGYHRGKEHVEAADKDQHWDAVLIPFGILEMATAQTTVIFGNSYQTSDFVVDALATWYELRKDHETCSPIKGEDYKEAMCGTLCFYGADGVRLHSIYLGHSPESGKASFYSLMRAEIIAAKNRCRNAILVGIADGAATNWIFLAEHVKVQIIAFFHVSEYLCDLAKEMFSNLNNRKEWLDNCFTGLKNTPNFAAKILDQFIVLERQSLEKSYFDSLKQNNYLFPKPLAS